MPDDHDTLDLALVVCTRDNIRTIRRTLQSVQGLARHVLVVDSGSTDGTLETCRELGARVVPRDWTGYAPQKQFALDQCAEHRWVLLLDSDESLEEDLAGAVRNAVAEDDPDVAGWKINRKVWFLGGWLHHTYQPDRVLRLVRSGAARVVAPEGGLHERLVVDGRVGRLAGVCRHDSWSGVRDLAMRQIDYAELGARTMSTGRICLHLLTNPPISMLRQLVFKGGFLDGVRGLIAAGMTFNYTMLKYAFMASHALERAQKPPSD